MRRVTRSLFALFVAVLGAPSSVYAADPPSASAQTDDFGTLVKKGDQARIAGKWSDALKAYAAALEIHDDPLVAGRLGLVLVEFQAYDAAVGKLFQAVENAAGANDAERMRFFQAFLHAKSQTCRVDVVIVQNGVNVEIDGEPRFAGRREGWTFVAPGKHKIKATLDGFEDETIEIDAPKGGQLNVKIELNPVKPTEEPAKQPDREPKTSKAEWDVPEDKPSSDLLEDKPPPPTNSTQTNGSFVVGLGGGFVIGATPTPAIGLNLFGAWRSRTWWEVGIDGRVAWTFLTDERFPMTQFVTWSAQLVPCGRWQRRWIGCGLVQVDGTQRTDGIEGGLLPGLGVRGGVEFETHSRVALQFVGDFVFHHRGSSFHLPGTTNTWDGSFVTGTVGIRASIKP